MTTQTVEPDTQPQPDTQPDTQIRTLRRSRRRVLGGVCGGLAAYTGVDVVVLRLLLTVLTLFAGAGVAVYAAAWILVPLEGSDRSLAERMLGR